MTVMEKQLFVLAAVLLSLAAASGVDECQSCIDQVHQMQTGVAFLRNAKLREIVTRSSARNICAAIGQCPEDGDNTDMQEEFYPAVDNGLVDVTALHTNSICHICRVTFNFLHNFLSNKHWQTVLLRLLKLGCHYIPLFSATCTNLVDQWGGMIIHLLVNYLNPRMCHDLLHICPNATAVSEAALAVDDCRMCEFGQGLVYDTVNDPSLHVRLDNLAREICIADGDQMDDGCVFVTSQLSEALKQVAADLKQSTALKTFCQTENICPAGLKTILDN
ncbi:hypothetical protein MAR_029697 [Mya arenaria]|uniref:Saposin B-type domain-containing protein n=1 Tax=Mya arenaria TaxID=6604 RepID=A0ABY7DJX7_MYAAR|nr:prosaposin-like [Mya arenaria]WAQ97007.1 hypothetical protein MAR_029697 [Mya arenaria]